MSIEKIVQSKYGETVTPMIMPAHKAMADSLATKTGADYDRTFYRLTVQHHREGVQMVDEMLVAQAERQFEIWTGQRPPEGLFRAAAGMEQRVRA